MRLLDAIRKRFASSSVEGECPAGHGDRSTGSRIVDVGWLLDTDKARFIWPDPKKVKRNDPPPTHAKSASYCPSIVEHEAKLWEISCPIDLNLGFRRDQQGKPAMVNLDGDSASVRSKHLNSMLALVSEKEWRHPQKPILQIITPYIFLSDEPVYMSQLPPIAHYRKEQWPGILLCGRLPTHIWLRPLMWAFEWHDISKPLILKRGEPWFYARFETFDPTRPVRLFEAERTPAVDEQIKGASAVSNYVSNTYSLFKTAQARRPKKLLVRKVRDDGNERAEDADATPE